jgi:regulator of sigma E protease
MAAGPFMNIITAVLLYALLFMAGVPQFVGDPDSALMDIVGVAAESPAALAGLQAGDVINTIAGAPVAGLTAVSTAINSHAGQEIEIAVQRGEEIVTVRLIPRLPEEIPPNQGASGIQISPHPEIVQYGPIEALIAGVRHTFQVIASMTAGLASLLRGLISPDTPAPEGGVGGVVAIGRIAAEMAQQGWRDLLSLTAFLSINLAILNMLPIPALDGGRIIFALVEMVRRKRIPPEKEALVHFAGFALLIALMVLVTFVDVSNWIAGKPPIPGG